MWQRACRSRDHPAPLTAHGTAAAARHWWTTRRMENHSDKSTALPRAQNGPGWRERSVSLLQPPCSSGVIHPGAHGTGLPPDGSGVSPVRETPQALWAACPSAQPPAQEQVLPHAQVELLCISFCPSAWPHQGEFHILLSGSYRRGWGSLWVAWASRAGQAQLPRAFPAGAMPQRPGQPRRARNGGGSGAEAPGRAGGSGFAAGQCRFRARARAPPGGSGGVRAKMAAGMYLEHYLDSKSRRAGPRPPPSRPGGTHGPRGGAERCPGRPRALPAPRAQPGPRAVRRGPGRGAKLGCGCGGSPEPAAALSREKGARCSSSRLAGAGAWPSAVPRDRPRATDNFWICGAVVLLAFYGVSVQMQPRFSGRRGAL